MSEMPWGALSQGKAGYQDCVPMLPICRCAVTLEIEGIVDFGRDSIVHSIALGEGSG
jgi:hypothetical protein